MMRRMRVALAALVFVGCGGEWFVMPPPPSPPPSPPTLGLVGHWEFDEGRDLIAYDSSGRGNDGTIVGANWTTGKISGALRFDGVDDHVTIAASDAPPPWTAAMWVNREDSPAPVAKLLSASSSNHTLRLEQYNNTNKVGFSGDVSQDYVFDYEAPIGKWAHLAFVCTGSETSLYADGLFVDTDSHCIDLPVYYIGTQTTDSTAKGLIDDVRIYDRALSLEEIQALASMGE